MCEYKNRGRGENLFSSKCLRKNLGSIEYSSTPPPTTATYSYTSQKTNGIPLSEKHARRNSWWLSKLTHTCQYGGMMMINTNKSDSYINYPGVVCTLNINTVNLSLLAVCPSTSQSNIMVESIDIWSLHFKHCFTEEMALQFIDFKNHVQYCSFSSNIFTDQY